ncbi:hypothetical protein [Sphingomonas sp. VNH70]|uniref:hypothetical protein n=1 Tax=Sphingomonas silueang TaxID=3156617 RepID=UPI0032B50930
MSDADMAYYEASLPGMTGECRAMVRREGLFSIPFYTDECFRMTQPRRWQGLWRTGFEDSMFCEVPATRCSLGSQPEDVWIEFKTPADFRAKVPDGLYRIDFIGRRTVVPGSHGHLGVARHAMVVDRLLFIDKVADTPR